MYNHRNFLSLSAVFVIITFVKSTHGGCCQTIKFENAGMADFYYPELMGSYGQISLLNGKPVYQQINGNAYLYWLSIGSWTIGAEIGDNESLGIRHIGQDSCPEYVKVETWEYWMDWMNEWEEDLWMEANCSDGPDPGPTDGPVEPCATGSLCDGCDIWQEQDGIKYCCAHDCDHGSLNVHTENGEVICECRH